MLARRMVPALGLLVLACGWGWAEEKTEGWIALFNGENLNGWKLRHDKYTATRFVDAEGKELKGARKGKVDQKDAVVDAKGKPIEGARVGKVDGKDVPVDADGKRIEGAKIVKTGGRDAIVGADGKEIAGARAVSETVDNPTGGWKVDKDVLTCGMGPHGSDIYTERKFTDFDLHVEFLPTANSGVYLLGLYEIQIDNSRNVKAKVTEKDGRKVETLPNNMCGSIYSRIAPSVNMAKDPTEWQSFDVTFRAARGEGKKVTEKARVTVVWNGTKVIDNAEIAGPTGSNLGGSEIEPGPIMLQGDHGRVSFRNVKIKPATAGR
jgi:hypothetical protein